MSSAGLLLQAYVVLVEGSPFVSTAGAVRSSLGAARLLKQVLCVSGSSDKVKVIRPV